MKEIDNEGWVKIHRKIFNNPVVCKDAETFFVWMYLLTHATHKNMDVWFKNERITLEPGQLIVGRKKIASELKVNEYKVQRILKLLENEQQIAQQTSSRNRLVSILNWNKYQETAQQNAQQLHNNCTTDAQQMHTNKNVRMKECKNERKNIAGQKFIKRNLSDLNKFYIN